MALASANNSNYVDDICVTLQDCMPCDYAAVLPDDMGSCTDLVVCRFGCELAELSRRIFLVSIWGGLVSSWMEEASIETWHLVQ